MSLKPLKVGVIGVGRQGKRHVLGYNQCKDVEVVAVCDIIKSVAKKVSMELNVNNIYTDYRDLIKIDDLDAVTIATPPYLHHEMANFALKNGKHVLCEKPLGMNLKETQDMYNTAIETGLIHMTGFQFRYVPAFTYMKTLLEDGFIGKIFQVNVIWMLGLGADSSLPLNWRYQKEKAGFGSMGGMGVHAIDMLRWTIGDFERVSGSCKTFIKERPLPNGSGIGKVTTEDACAFLADLQGDIQAVFHMSSVALKDNYYSITVHGEKGALRLLVDMTKPNWAVGTLSGGQKRDDVIHNIVLPQNLMKGFKPNGTFASNYQYLQGELAKQFIQAIRENKKTQPSFLEGLESTRVAEAVYRSQNEKRWVTLNEM